MSEYVTQMSSSEDPKSEPEEPTSELQEHENISMIYLQESIASQSVGASPRNVSAQDEAIFELAASIALAEQTSGSQLEEDKVEELVTKLKADESTRDTGYGSGYRIERPVNPAPFENTEAHPSGQQPIPSKGPNPPEPRWGTLKDSRMPDGVVMRPDGPPHFFPTPHPHDCGPPLPPSMDHFSIVEPLLQRIKQLEMLEVHKKTLFFTHQLN